MVVVGVRAQDVEGFAETSRGKCADEGFCRHHKPRDASRDGVTRNYVTEFVGE
jgi:hypothetical protein